MRRSDDSKHFVDFAPGRRVFLSFDSRDIGAVRRFVERWSKRERVFGYLGVGILSGDPAVIESDEPGYIMRKIRQRYMRQTNVTIVLLGERTHRRRYVDWEIKATLDPGVSQARNGLLGIALGAMPELPARLRANVETGYAACHPAPASGRALGDWIDAAYRSRSRRSIGIANTRELQTRDLP